MTSEFIPEAYQDLACELCREEYRGEWGREGLCEGRRCEEAYELLEDYLVVEFNRITKEVRDEMLIKFVEGELEEF